jgi:hypothetical protein
MPRLLLGLLFLAASPAAAQERCTSSAAQVVDDIYKQVLERPADAGSAMFTEGLVSGKMTVRDIVAEVGKSREHQERFFWRPLIAGVYREVLQRDPSGEEQQIAARELMGGTQTVDGFVAHTAARAANNAQDAVRILYLRLLGREPDPDGLRNHTELAQRQGLEAVAQSIVASPEYKSRHSAGASGDNGVSYEAGVRALYQHLLGREADPDGLRALMQLASVYGLPAVADRIVSSPEYAQRYGSDTVPGSGAQRFCAPPNASRPALPRRR